MLTVFGCWDEKMVDKVWSDLMISQKSCQIECSICSVWNKNHKKVSKFWVIQNGHDIDLGLKALIANS